MIFELILIGLAITLEPIPLTAFLLVLASKGGAKKGAAFTFGWLASIAIVMAVTILATGDNPPKPSTEPSLAALAVKIAIGVALVLLAFRQRRRMGRPKKPKKPPKWQASIDNMSIWYAMGLAPLVQPWGLVAVGVATIVEAKLSSWLDYLALLMFVVLATAVYLALEIYAVVRAEQCQALLARLRHWIDTHTDQVIIVVFLVLGFWLIGKSLYLIVT